ncbi:MAG: glycosyltransferase, partial [Holophagales bacterium]|nr:glycosyltransferase [Holophagales bacterium]
MSRAPGAAPVDGVETVADHRTAARSSTPPAVSVVIPTYGRRRDLLRTLEAYGRQQPRDLPFEVVVVDDGSEDGTSRALARLRPDRFCLRAFRQANAGPATARNRALAAAEAPLVFISGDDIEPSPDLLLEHRRAHDDARDPRLAVLGLTRWPPPAPDAADASRGGITATMRHIDGPGGQQFSYGGFTDGGEYDFRHLYTSNISLHRRLLEREVGPSGQGPFSDAFPAAAFEDAELGHRLAFHGLRIVYRASAVAYHHHPYDARSFFRRQVRCGEMAAILFRQSPELERWLGIAELEWRRLELLRLGEPERRRLAHLADAYPAWRRAALDLAVRL